MKTILTSIATGSLLAALAAAQPQTQSQRHSQRRYTVIDLGTLGGAYSFGFGINTAGDIAGAAATPAQTDFVSATAYLWTRQTGMVNLGVLGPPAFPACPTCSSGAAGVAARGQVAIGSEIATLDPNGEDYCQYGTHRECLGAIWRNGVMTALPTLPGGNNANVFWVNNRGQVSGHAETGVRDSTCSVVTPSQVRRFLPVIWKPNGEIERVLSPLVSKGDTVAYAFTINDYGQAVGASGLCSTTGLPPFAINNTTATHAVLWERDGSVTDLGSLGGAANIASSVNNRGEVVGTAQSPKDGTIHAFLWTRHTGMLDYGGFPGAVATVPGCCHTINDRGEIVGFSIELSDPYGGRALIWQGNEPKDLNDFVRNPGPFVRLSGAFSINDAGDIVCQGVTTKGEVHACLATPNHGEERDEDFPTSTEGRDHAVAPENAGMLLRRRFGIRPR
jgi:probable HAF family extracellular repeat protein